MKTSVELEQKQILKLSQEMKLSFSVLSMSYSEVLKFWLGKIEGSRQSTEDSFFESLSQEEDFFQYLENQLMYLEVSENIRQKLIFCIHSLNEAGFLELSDDELRHHLGISQKELEELHQSLWELEPVGVGTHNFKEAIRLQLKKKNEWEEIIWEVLQHLEYIAEGQEEKLAEKLGIGLMQLNQIMKKIKACNPKPSRGFSVRKTIKIVPDFYWKYSEGNIALEENKDLQKSLYRAEIKETPGIQMLRKCIEKRIETLRNILEYVTDYQKDYLLGSGPLKTLYEKEVAEQLEFHVSTISRAIQNKYLKTERGIFSVKSLFCYSGEREEMKVEIQNLIEKEDKQKPYSDLEIAMYLGQKFLRNISRRTVSKYRKELGYFSSFQRKK